MSRAPRCSWSFITRSLLLTVVALLSACTSTTTSVADRVPVTSEPAATPTANPTPNPTATPQKEVVTEWEFAATVEFVKAAAERLDTTPHRFENFLSPAPGALDPSVGGTTGPVETGETNGTIATSTIDLSVMSSSEEPDLFRYSIIDGSMLYQFDPSRNVVFPWLADSEVSGVIGLSADGWVVMDWSKISPGNPFRSTASAVDLVAGFDDADLIEEGPAAVVRGVETRSVRASFLPSSLFPEGELDDETTDRLLRDLDNPEAELTVYLDATGVIRQITTTLGSEIERRVEYFDIGETITIELPEAIDITDELLAERAAFEANETATAEPLDPAADDEVTESPEPEGFTIMELLAAQPELSILLSLVNQQPDVLKILSEPTGEWTLFAPTNDAFRWLGEDELAALQSDPDRLRSMLGRHVAMGSLTVGGISSPTAVKMLVDDVLDLVITDNGQAQIDGTYILVSDVFASNGVMHIVPDVLIAE